ncbi:MAG: hypothetical protein AAF578_11960 [Pseudomonadota bacterium]
MSREPLPLITLLRDTAELVLDARILLFAALISFLLAFGFAAVMSPVTMVPALLVLIFATSALFKFTTIVTRSLALGLPLPSAESAVFDYFRSVWAFSPWAVFIAYNALLIFIGSSVSEVLAYGLLFLSAPFIPAALGVMAVNGSPWGFLNLKGLLHVIGVLKLDYLKIILIWFVAGLIAAWLRSQGGFGAGMLSLLVGVLQTFALFVSTGLVFYHHHAALGIPIERAPLEERMAQQAYQAVERERQTALDQAYAFFSRDNSVGGLQRLKSYWETHPEDPQALPWFLDKMKTWERYEPALLFARNYLAVLLAEGREKEATRLLLWCLSVDQRFMPDAPERAAARALLEGYDEAEIAARWP